MDCPVWLSQRLGITGWQKLAVADSFALMVTAQVPEKEQTSQLMNRFPEEATGVKVTLPEKVPEQVPGQDIPAGLLVTVPLPATVTVSVWFMTYAADPTALSMSPLRLPTAFRVSLTETETTPE